ncbi:MAG: aspartate 1-decarboxylase [bacterium]
MPSYRRFVRAKIQRLRVTGKSLRYEGSLELDAALSRAAGILPHELVQVVNVNNGQRFETYVIDAPDGSGACVLNGAAARLGEVDDELIVMSVVLVDDSTAPPDFVRVRVDGRNRVVE